MALSTALYALVKIDSDKKTCPELGTHRPEEPVDLPGSPEPLLYLASPILGTFSCPAVYGLVCINVRVDT